MKATGLSDATRLLAGLQGSERCVRKVGRAGLECTNGVHRLAEAAAGGTLMLDAVVADKRPVETYANT